MYMHSFMMRVISLFISLIPAFFNRVHCLHVKEANTTVIKICSDGIYSGNQSDFKSPTNKVDSTGPS